MAEIIPMPTAKMVWPWAVPTRVVCEHNGHQRGEWFYRAPLDGEIRGPFHNADEAFHYLQIEQAGNNRV